MDRTRWTWDWVYLCKANKFSFGPLITTFSWNLLSSSVRCILPPLTSSMPAYIISRAHSCFWNMICNIWKCALNLIDAVERNRSWSTNDVDRIYYYLYLFRFENWVIDVANCVILQKKSFTTYIAVHWLCRWLTLMQSELGASSRAHSSVPAVKQKTANDYYCQTFWKLFLSLSIVCHMHCARPFFTRGIVCFRLAKGTTKSKDRLPVGERARSQQMN